MAEDRRNKRKKHNILLCVLVMLLLFPVTGSAAEISETDLEIQYPKKDAEIHVYKVAYPVELNQYEMMESLKKYDKEILNFSDLKDHFDELSTTEKKKLAVTLKSNIIADKIEPEYRRRTDKQGKIKIESLEAGIYLIFGEKIELKGAVYFTAPILIEVKGKSAEDKVRLDFTSKISPNNIDRECTVMKIWKDDNSKKKRPEEIEVILLKDGQQYDTVSLNKRNNWEHTWKNLDAVAEWLIVEKDVPEDYKVEYETGKGYIVVENILVEEEKPDGPNEKIPPEDEIPQTGQLWWPIPVLAAIGMVLFSLGWAMKNREERLGEE